nr:hypothetical protein [Spiribacter salilacus]
MKIITLGKIICPVQRLEIEKVVTTTQSDGLDVVDFPTPVNALAVLIAAYMCAATILPDDGRVSA